MQSPYHGKPFYRPEFKKNINAVPAVQFVQHVFKLADVSGGRLGRTLPHVAGQYNGLGPTRLHPKKQQRDPYVRNRCK